MEIKARNYYAYEFEKAFDKVPREVIIRQDLKKVGVEQWLVCAVMAMHRQQKDNIMLLA